MTDNSISQSAARTYSVVDLVAAALEGRVRVPDFQRPLRWQWQDVQRLFDSIVKGYPIGSLLLWKREAPEGDVKFGGLKFKARRFEDGWWVVDGQQRLISLANALSSNIDDDRFSLAYDLNKKGFVRPGKVEDGYIVPLPILFDLQALIRWFTKDHPEAAEKLDEASRVTRSIREYQVPAYLVEQSDENTLRDIFDRMNNYGKRLKLAEVFSALYPTPKKEDGPSINFQQIAESLNEDYGFGIIDDDTIMRAILARRGADVTRDIRVEFTEKVRSAREFNSEDIEAAYNEGQLALKNAINFLQNDACIPHFAFLPYRYLLVVLVRFFAHFKAPHVRNRELLVRWFWRAAMIGAGPFTASSTAAVRTLAARIQPNQENESIERLMSDPISKTLPLLKFTGFRTSSAQSRILLSALWALRPRSPITGSIYTINELSDQISLDGTLAEVTPRIFEKEPEDRRGLVANRFLIIEQDLPTTLRDMILNPFLERKCSNDDFLASHALDETSLTALTNNDTNTFIDARQIVIERTVSDFLAQKAGLNFEDTPPLESLDLDNLDQGRDDEFI